MIVRALMVELDHALFDRRLLGGGFGDLSTWRTWFTVLKAAFGRPLNSRERDVFASVAGPRAVPTKRVRELWAILGRRSGKSRIAAAIAVYLALFVKHRLARGERGAVLVLAATLDQARTVFDYVKGFLEASPTLSKEVAGIKRAEIAFRNGIVIAVHSNSFRTV